MAYIVPSESKGYGGKIKMLVAVTADSKVIDFSILEHNETPGLGDNAQKPEFRQMFAGKGADKLTVTKDPANKDNIQAMTGATISSRAVTKGVRIPGAGERKGQVVSDSYTNMLNAGKKLQSFIKESRGWPNKDMDKFVKELDALCEKYKR